MWVKTTAIIMLIVGPAFAAPTFEAQSVPQHAYTGGWEHYVGGGLAVFDCDNDDRLDLVAAGGESPLPFGVTSVPMVGWFDLSPNHYPS